MPKKTNQKQKSVDEILKNLSTIAEKYFIKNQNEFDPVHKWDHTKRVMGAVDKILDYEPNANINKVKIAAIFHDIGRHHKEGNHAFWSAETAKDILVNKLSNEDVKLLEINISEIIKIIKYHNKKPEELPSDLINDLELKILTDADKIDMFGAIGIIRDLRDEKPYDFQIDHIKEKSNPKDYKYRSEGGLKVGKRYKSFLGKFLIEYYFQKNQFEK